MAKKHESNQRYCQHARIKAGTMCFEKTGCHKITKKRLQHGKGLNQKNTSAFQKTRWGAATTTPGNRFAVLQMSFSPPLPGPFLVSWSLQHTHNLHGSPQVRCYLQSDKVNNLSNISHVLWMPGAGNCLTLLGLFTSKPLGERHECSTLLLCQRKYIQQHRIHTIQL